MANKEENVKVTVIVESPTGRRKTTFHKAKSPLFDLQEQGKDYLISVEFLVELDDEGRIHATLDEVLGDGTDG